jgi:hypothetical protein
MPLHGADVDLNALWNQVNGVAGATAVTVSAGTISGNLDLRGNIVDGAQASGVVGVPIALANVGTVAAETIGLQQAAQTLTLTGGYTTQRFALFAQPTLSGAQTVTNAATVAIANAPAAAGGATITNPYALWVQGGRSRFDGIIGGAPGATLQIDASSGQSLVLSGGGTFSVLVSATSIQFATSAIALKDFQRSRQTPTETVLVSGVDATAGELVSVTLSAARLVGAPLNPATGQRLTFILLQNGTGGFAVTWNAVFKVSWSDTGNTANKRSMISFVYDGTNWCQDGAQTPYIT